MRVHVSLSEEEVAAVDAVRKERGIARSTWIAGAIRLRLHGLDQERAMMKALSEKGPREADLRRDLLVRGADLV